MDRKLKLVSGKLDLNGIWVSIVFGICMFFLFFGCFAGVLRVLLVNFFSKWHSLVIPKRQRIFMLNCFAPKIFFFEES